MLAMNASASPDAVTGAPGRPTEIEEATNLWFIHPLSRRVVDVLARTQVTPNQVSVASVFMAAGGAFCYARLAWPVGAVAGLLLMIAWHVLDGADGDLARRTGRASAIGELVDGVCDHVSQGCLYIALAWMAQATLGLPAWALMTGAALSHFIQANAYETGRKTYRRWVYGADWMRQTQAAPGGNLFQTLLGGLYVGLSQLVGPGEAAVDDAMIPRLQAGGDTAAAARGAYRAAHMSLVKASSWLSSNNRTMAAFLAVLAMRPAWFFLYEITALNLALVAVLLVRGAKNRTLAAALA
jgi:phosphatidylglycerophosphate synthase